MNIINKAEIVSLNNWMVTIVRKMRVRLRIKIYPVLWSIIIVASVYLLIRFAVLSFSEDLGQASWNEALIAKLCTRMLESDSSLIGYTAKGDSIYAFPVSLVQKDLALGEFAKDSSMSVNEIHSYAALLNDEEEDDKISSEEDTQDVQAVMEEDVGKVIDASDSVADMEIYNLQDSSLGMEYIMTNGSVIRSSVTGALLGDEQLAQNQLQVDYLKGDISKKETEDENDSDAAVETSTTGEKLEFTMDQLKDINFLIRNFYIVDPSTKVTESLFDAEKLLKDDMTMEQDGDKPQILIYHTHSQEAYKDSRSNKESDTVVGVGSCLTKILEEDYGYQVIHDKTTYDIVNGKLDRNVAYSQAEDGIDKILKENPSIEVVIDLHRDGSPAKTTMVDGKETAQIMLFNGLCRDQNGPISYLENPYLQDNLAFSLQLQIKSRELYPGLFYKNYLKSYRYNMQVRPKSILMELGTNNNTLESAKNAMAPFAKILDAVLKGE